MVTSGFASIVCGICLLTDENAKNCLLAASLIVVILLVKLREIRLVDILCKLHTMVSQSSLGGVSEDMECACTQEGHA